MSRQDDFYNELVDAFRGFGHTKANAEELFKIVNDTIQKQLLRGRFQIRGFVTVTVNAQEEPCYDGFTGEFRRRKLVVRAGARVGRELRRKLSGPTEPV